MRVTERMHVRESDRGRMSVRVTETMDLGD